MPYRRGRGTWAVGVTAVVVLLAIGTAPAQDPERVPEPDPKGADVPPEREKPKKDRAPRENGNRRKNQARPKRGGLRVPAPLPERAAAKKKARNAADPLGPAAKGEGGAGAPAWPFRFQFKLAADDGTPLDATYYPPRTSMTAPALLLVHEKGGAAKDFEDPIDELKNRGLAEHLQREGYAVLAVDFRGPAPATTKAEAAPKAWRGKAIARDLQAAYQFLLDRHNRAELNLSKFGVVAVGEGADLVAAWAAMPGAATASEGRVSDLGALALVSPLAEAAPAPPLAQVIPKLAPRVPILLTAGARDALSSKPIEDVRGVVERHRLSRVALLPTPLHGAKFVRLAPQAPATIAKFLDGALKFRKDDWEPRYNLAPVEYTDGQVIRPKGDEKEKDKEKAKDAAEPKAKAKADPAAKKGRAAPKAKAIDDAEEKD